MDRNSRNLVLSVFGGVSLMVGAVLAFAGGDDAGAGAYGPRSGRAMSGDITASSGKAEQLETIDTSSLGKYDPCIMLGCQGKGLSVQGN